MPDFNLAVIGAGAAGLSVTAGDAQLGLPRGADRARPDGRAYGLAIARRVPVSALALLVMPYPTRAEAGKRAAGSLLAARLFSPRTKSLVRLLARLP